MPSRVSAQRFWPAEHDVGAPRPVVVAARRTKASKASSLACPPGPVAAVVAERDGVGQGDVDADAAGDRGGDLGDLEGVRQPGPLVVGRVHDDLGLAGQPAEGRRVHDPVAVALEAGPLRVGRLGHARGARPRRPASPPAAAARARAASRSSPVRRRGPGRRSAREPACARTRSPSRVAGHGLGPGLRPRPTARPGQPPETPCSASARSRSTPEVSSSQCSGSATLSPRAALAAAGRAQLGDREGERRGRAGRGRRRGRRRS